jgi:hypothetical protein
MTAPRIQRTYDDYDQRVVRVELRNRPGVFAVVDEADFDRLITEGIRPIWVLNEACPGFFYVRCYQLDVAGGLGLVARHVMQAGVGEQVKYRSTDRLDLRRRNLMVVPGRAKGQTPLRDEFSPPPRRAAAPAATAGVVAPAT